MRLRLCLIVPCVALLLSFSTTAAVNAGFVASVTGAAQVISPPPFALPGALLSNDYQVWDESSGVIKSNLTLDMGGQPGSYDGLSNFSKLTTTLTAGTAYESVMIQLDPQTQFPAQDPIASITFNSKIIGLALFGPSLNASDVYGSPTTVYPHGLPNFFLQTRGIDYTHNDRFSISSNGMTLNLQLTAGFLGFDEIRVFLAAPSGGVPEPASWMIWSGIGLVLTLRRRLSQGLRAYTC